MSKQIKENIDVTFKKELEEIAMKNHIVSHFPPSIRRITKAIRRHSLWPRIKEDILNTPLEDDRWKNVE